MIICSCNVLSDKDVRSAVDAERTHSISQVYGCLGCSVRCGRCARTIRRIVNEVLAVGRHPATATHGNDNPKSTVNNPATG